jgi:hypothetical protein
VNPAGLEAARALGEASKLCPHPAARARAVVVVQKANGSMALCLACKRGFERIIAGWNAGQLGPRQVVAQVVDLGYTPRDGAALVLGLMARRLRVRLGFREAA